MESPDFASDFASFFTRLKSEQTSGSLAAFAVSPQGVDAFVAAGREQGVTAELLRLSQLTAEAPALPPPPALPVIYQDLAYPAFLEHVEPLVDRLIYPLWHGRRPFCFFSSLDQSCYEEKSISPAAIHNDFTAVYRFLLCEQLLALLAAPAPPQPPTPAPVHPLDPDLDPEQDRARRHLAGPIRVLAPAGSGKTKTLTNRIVHLLNEGIAGEQILALAFNKKAAQEMNERLEQKGVPGVAVRTYHALGYHILQQKLGWRFDGRQATRQTRRLLQQAVSAQAQLPARRGADPLEPFLVALRRAKTELLPLEEMIITVEEHSLPFGPIFDHFLRLQQRQRLLTFDDMIYLAARVLLKDDALRRHYQARFHFVLVDEFQDLNKAQLLLLHLLALPQNNLFVVGDDDQMIYGWRGAAISHILDFTQRFPMAVDVTLRTNYRCSRQVVEHSRRLIDYNRERVPKEIQPRPGAQPGHFAVELCPNLWEQATWAAQWIRARAQPGSNWRDFAVLYRYRAYQYPLALALDQLELPHTAVNLPRLFTTAVGLDLLAYCTAVLQPDSLTAAEMARILKRPNKSLTNQLIHSLPDWAALLAATRDGSLRPWEREKLQKLVADLLALRRLDAGLLSPASLLHHLEVTFELNAFYRSARRHLAELDEENDLILLETLFAVAANFSQVSDFFAYMRQAVAGELPDETEGDSEVNGVVLSTIHQAKGKEWPTVIYFNLSRGSHSSQPEEIEEERRVAYVGVTRARDDLAITAVDGRPSPFLLELTADPQLASLNLSQLRRQWQTAGQTLRQMEKQLQRAEQRLQAAQKRPGDTAVAPSILERLRPATAAQLPALQEKAAALARKKSHLVDQVARLDAEIQLRQRLERP